jgi:hypothetical protein
MCVVKLVRAVLRPPVAKPLLRSGSTFRNMLEAVVTVKQRAMPCTKMSNYFMD